MKPILQKDVQQFINENIKTDIRNLLLKKSPFHGVDMAEIAAQIKGRNVAEKKFPFLLKPEIVFPPQLSLEQSSSEAAAQYKSSVVGGENLVDLTSGLGVDAFFMSQNFDEVALVERDAELIKTVEHNFLVLGKKASFFNVDLEDFLEKNKNHFDWLYLDPARRDESKNKVFLLEDLSPNILKILPKLEEISSQILIKLSPLIDISYLITSLKKVKEIHIVSLKNEVKEVLVMLGKEKSENPKIIAVNLETGEPPFSFYFQELKTSKSEYSKPLRFLYIPNHSILKSGAFDLISEKFHLKKLHPNTHFYTSADNVKGFPGRVLEVEQIDAKSIQKKSQFNIISKNHPLKPEEIKKKYQLKDGGKNYLIFTQSINGKIILKSV